MQLKRKGADNGVISTDPGSDQLPSKKLRQDWGSPFPAIYETTHNSIDTRPNWVEARPIVDEPIVEVCPVEIPNDTPVHNSVSAPLFVTEPDADDRALVLYKPSIRSPIQVNGTFPAQYKDFQVSDAVDWFSPSRSFKQDSALTHGKAVTSNSLAVIPYVAPCSVRSTGVDAYGGGLIIEDITDQVREEEEQGDPMVVEEVTPMEEEGDQMDVSDAVPQFGSQGCDYEQWQQRFGSPQYTPVMWS